MELAKLKNIKISNIFWLQISVDRFILMAQKRPSKTLISNKVHILAYAHYVFNRLDLRSE